MGCKLIDLMGQTFGRLYVIKRSDRKMDYNGETLWDCLCECGKTGMFRSRDLRRGHSQSCGCLCRERVIASNIRRAGNGRSKNKGTEKAGASE